MISSKRDGSQDLDLLKYDRNNINTSYFISTKRWSNGDESHGRKDMKGPKSNQNDQI